MFRWDPDPTLPTDRCSYLRLGRVPEPDIPVNNCRAGSGSGLKVSFRLCLEFVFLIIFELLQLYYPVTDVKAFMVIYFEALICNGAIIL